MKRTVRVWARLAAVALIALVAGCVKEDVRGDTSVFSFEPWIMALTVVGGIAGVPLGLAIRNKIPRLAWAMIIGGPILLVFIAPGLFLDKATVDREHFEARYGMWFAPSTVNVRFDDLSKMHFEAQTKGFGRRRRTDRWMDLAYKSGRTERVPMGDLLRNLESRLRERAAQKGVEVDGNLEPE